MLVWSNFLVLEVYFAILLQMFFEGLKFSDLLS